MTPAGRAAIEAAVATARGHLPADATIVGVGWATIELERAGRDLGLEAADAPDDIALGARCRAVAADAGLRLVLLEPSTEGRLAASLARLGEGPHVTWWAWDEADAVELLGTLPGPLGPARLVRTASRDGRWSFLCDRGTATISG